MKKPMFVTVLLFLSACSFNYKGDTSGSASYAPRLEGSDAQACMNSCNNSYARCMDSAAAGRSIDEKPSILGASGGCESSLKSCLPSCRGR